MKLTEREWRPSLSLKRKVSLRSAILLGVVLAVVLVLPAVYLTKVYAAAATTCTGSNGNINCGSFTVNGGSITYSAAGTLAIPSNTQNALQVTDGTNAYFTVDTRTTTNIQAYTFTTPGPTIASGVTTPFVQVYVPPYTTTLTGTTTTTSAHGLMEYIGQPVLTDTSAMTVTKASSLYVDNAPACNGSVTCTNTYAEYVNAGASYFGGIIESASSFKCSGSSVPSSSIFAFGCVSNALIFNAPAADNFQFWVGGSQVAVIGSGGGIARINGINTVGVDGVPAVYATYSTNANSALVTNAINYTPPATAGTYRVCTSVNVHTAAAVNMAVTLAYKDAGGNAKSYTVQLAQEGTATVVVNMNNAASVFSGCVEFTIDNSATAITLSTTGTTQTSYDFAATLEQLA